LRYSFISKEHVLFLAKEGKSILGSNKNVVKPFRDFFQSVRNIISYASLRSDAISPAPFSRPFPLAPSAMQITLHRTHLGMLQVRGTEPLIAAVRC